MRFTAVFAALSVVTLAAGQAEAQDAAAGATVFKKCAVCHVADADTNKIGPSLKGVIGRTAGTHPNFSYSNAMVAAGQAGLVWSEATLTTYLHDPRAMVKGTKMAFVGLEADADVANVIAYLKQFSQ